MKIAVVAANGRVGRAVVIEAYQRKHIVTAFGRGENKTITSRFTDKDLFYITKEDLEGCDAVVDAFGVWIPSLFANYAASANHLCKLLRKTETQLVVVGNAGILYTDETHTEQLMDTPQYPSAFRAIASAAGEALDALRKHDDVLWTYLVPANNFQPDGLRTRKYLFAGEEWTKNEFNQSVISYGDYASALLDIIESGECIHEVVSVYRA